MAALTRELAEIEEELAAPPWNSPLSEEAAAGLEKTVLTHLAEVNMGKTVLKVNFAGAG